MSKKICYYSNIKAETAYIAGIVEALAAPLDMELGREHLGLDTDVFWVGESGIEGLYDALLNRLRKYNAIDELELDLERDSFMPNLPVVRVEGNKTADSVGQILRSYRKFDKLVPLTRDFFFSVNWYLKQPRALYKTDMQALYEYMPELEEALRAFYLFVISELLFVEYDGYVLMLAVGASE